MKSGGVVFIVAGVEIDRAVVDHRRGVGGEIGLYDRILCTAKQRHRK